MNFRQAFEITNVYTKLSPLRRDFYLAPGKITKIDVHFPSGCAGLVGIRVFRGSFQLWPLTVGQWIVTSGATPSMPETFILDERPYGLTFEGYNEDETYSHTITLGVSVEIVEDVNRALIEVVSARLPEHTEAYLQYIAKNYSVSVECKELLEAGLIPLLEDLRDIEKREEQRELEKLGIRDLVVM